MMGERELPVEGTASPRGGRLLHQPCSWCAVGLVFLLAVTKVSSYDTWVHLSLGRWMWENGRIPRHNILSYTQPDRPAVDHQWLFQAGLYAVWRAGGAAGAILLKAAVVAAASAALLATARRKGADPFVAALVVLLGAFAARFRFTLRPQVMAFLLLALYLYLLERWRHGGKQRLLLLLLPLQVLWANLHGSALVGCALPLAYAVGESVRAAAGRRFREVAPSPRPGRDLLVLWAVALALVPVALLNPNGPRVLTEPFALAEAQRISGLKEFLLDRSSVKWPALGGRHLFLAILAAMGLLSLPGSLVRKDVTEVGLFGGLLAVALLAERFVGLFVVAAAPIVARNLTAVLSGFAKGLAAGLEQHRFRTLLGPVLLAGLAVVLEVAWRRGNDGQPFGLGVTEGQFPEQEVAFIQERCPEGNLLNEWEHGGYIYWRTRRPVFLDSRGLLAYDAAFVRHYREAWGSRERWQELVEQCRIAVALVGPRQGAPRDLVWQFRADKRWVAAHVGPAGTVFVRRDAWEAGQGR